jgi:rhodanese-related sulfurtransferase
MGEMKTAKDMVAQAKTRVENLTPAQVADEMQNRKAVLVDIRETEERTRDGVIPGAVHASRGMLEFYADPTSPHHKKELDPTRRVVLHCASGGRSALAAETLKQMGYQNVAHLDGGIKAWKEQGKPTGTPATASEAG